MHYAKHNIQSRKKYCKVKKTPQFSPHWTCNKLFEVTKIQYVDKQSSAHMFQALAILQFKDGLLSTMAAQSEHMSSCVGFERETHFPTTSAPQLILSSSGNCGNIRADFNTVNCYLFLFSTLYMQLDMQSDSCKAQ